MKVTLGDKLGAQLSKFRVSIPSTPKTEGPQPVMGVVVPDPVPHLPTAVSTDRRNMKLVYPISLPEYDQGQLVGELLDWLFEKQYFKDSVTRSSLLAAQQRFFKEHDNE